MFLTIIISLQSGTNVLCLAGIAKNPLCKIRFLTFNIINATTAVHAMIDRIATVWMPKM